MTGFSFSKDQLFWLVAIPGLAAGILRIIHTFILPIFGTRHVVTFATFIKLIPVIGIGFAVMDVNTPFWIFAILAFTCGFGGGDFSSYMPSTSLFFPKRLKGTALGIQAGIGNFGVSLAQFITPLILSVSIYGAASVFTSIDAKETLAVFKSSSIEKQKDKNGIVKENILTKKWYDWIDYWSVDFNYESKPEIIKFKTKEGRIEEEWTGNYVFENEWQSFKEKKDGEKLELKSSEKEILSGKTKVAVKVVDIFGNDTMKILQVKM